MWMDVFTQCTKLLPCHFLSHGGHEQAFWFHFPKFQPKKENSLGSWGISVIKCDNVGSTVPNSRSFAKKNYNDQVFLSRNGTVHVTRRHLRLQTQRPRSVATRTRSGQKAAAMCSRPSLTPWVWVACPFKIRRIIRYKIGDSCNEMIQWNNNEKERGDVAWRDATQRNATRRRRNQERWFRMMIPNEYEYDEKR